MEIGSRAIGPEGGHIAGRQLLKAMYEAKYGSAMPEISVSDRGKPYFPDSAVYFSISHTPNRVFCVLCDCPVGIDAEEEDRDISLKIAEKILSPAEKSRFVQAMDPRRALLRLWVLKEASVKCSGQGLTGYPNQTDFFPDDPRIQKIHGCYVAVIKENHDVI